PPAIPWPQTSEAWDTVDCDPSIGGNLRGPRAAHSGATRQHLYLAARRHDSPDGACRLGPAQEISRFAARLSCARRKHRAVGRDHSASHDDPRHAALQRSVRAKVWRSRVGVGAVGVRGAAAVSKESRNAAYEVSSWWLRVNSPSPETCSTSPQMEETRDCRCTTQRAPPEMECLRKDCPVSRL